MNRRNFLSWLGVGATATASASLVSVYAETVEPVRSDREPVKPGVANSFVIKNEGDKAMVVTYARIPPKELEMPDTPYEREVKLRAYRTAEAILLPGEELRIVAVPMKAT